jgi:hypothetical protein
MDAELRMFVQIKQYNKIENSGGAEGGLSGGLGIANSGWPLRVLPSGILTAFWQLSKVQEMFCHNIYLFMDLVSLKI